MITNEGLLFIEPESPAAARPVIDDLTMRMCMALRWSTKGLLIKGRLVPGGAYRGVHDCICGVSSDNHDYLVMGNRTDEVTHSLAAHYLAYHRDDVSQFQIDKLRRVLDPAPIGCRVELYELKPPALIPS